MSRKPQGSEPGGLVTAASDLGYRLGSSVNLAFVGREAERRAIRQALNDPDVRVIVVEGRSGAGKTALVETVISELHESGAIVGRGKYAEGRASSAFLPVLEALSEAINNALELLYDPVAGAASLREAMQPQLRLLAGAGLRVADITPAALDPMLGVGQGGAARIVEACLHLLGWLNGFGVPVVLFIDDWHRAPRDADIFMTAVARERDRCSLLLAERYAPAPVRSEIENKVLHVALGPLEERDRQALLETATAESGAGSVIAEWLGNSASGLPFDLIEAARALDECQALIRSERGWTIDEVRAASIDRADFTDAILRRVRQLSAAALHTGMAIALWGDSAPLDLVAEALGANIDDVVADAARLQSLGVIDIANLRARVLHDRLRAALLSALDPGTRSRLAAQMSERMASWPDERWREIARTGLYLRLSGGLEDASPAVWRDRFALGALVARTVADTSAATEFAEAAWHLRGRLGAANSDADHMILREATIAAAARRDRGELEARAKSLIATTEKTQRGDAYEIAVLAARLAGESDLAWRWVVEGFRSFGIHLPATARVRHLVWPILQWRLALRFRRSAETKNMTAGTVDPLVRLANIASVIAFDLQPMQAMLIALKAANHARRNRYFDPIWLATDAFISASLGDHARAAELGALAARHAERSAYSPATTLFRALYFGETFKRPLAELFADCEKIYQWSIAEGDAVNAALAVRHDARIAWRIFPTLDALLARLANDERRAERLADDQAINAVRELISFAKVLKGDDVFVGRAAPVNPVDYVEVLSLRGDWPTVVAFCEQMKDLRPQLNFHPGGTTWRFHETLARTRMGLAPRKGDVAFVRRAAVLNPVDHRAKLLLLEAELARAKNDRRNSLEAYALATDFAAKGSSRLEEGLVAEFAEFGSRILGDNAGAERYAAIAQSVWRRCGALAKLAEQSPSERPHADAARVAEAEALAAVAARSERAKSRFLAEVAHELRTPLQGMQGLVELAADGKENVDMKELRDVLGSLRNVVDDLTELEALGAGAPLNLQPTDVAGLLEAEATVFAALARQKGLSFTTSIAASTAGHFLVDASRLRQIVRNLLSNAVKYVDRGSATLHASAVVQSPVSVTFTIAVEDTGPGISELDLPRLFEPFERGGREDGSGLGLGLALSRRIAERMSGQLFAENRKPEGARFVLSFPAERGEAATPESTAVVPRLKVLLVEDVPLSRRMIAALLRRDGHEVREAGGGFEAIEICRREKLDLVFLDLGLPDIDGLEVLERIRDTRLPVVVLTASAVPAMKERATRAGAVMTLRKPASGEELRHAIAQVLSRPQIAATVVPGAEFQSLATEAQREIEAMAREIVDHASSMDSTAIRIKAHRLAGLAAQFDATDVAKSADGLEAAVIAGEELAPALTGLAIALVRFRAG